MRAIAVVMVVMHRAKVEKENGFLESQYFFHGRLAVKQHFRIFQ